MTARDDLIPYISSSLSRVTIYVSPHIARAANLSFRLFSLNNLHSYCYRWHRATPLSERPSTPTPSTDPPGSAGPSVGVFVCVCDL